MFRYCAILCGLFGMLSCPASGAESLRIVAAENVYGSLAQEIGGSYVQVTSILKQPDQDPHLFTLSPRVVQQIQQADLLVFNGLGYDPWIQRVLSASTRAMRTVICVSQLMGKHEGDNPHLWYDPVTMPIYAKAFLEYLSQKDPAHDAIYRLNYKRFLEHYARLTGFIEQIKPRTRRVKVIATEPVLTYMAEALGFNMQGMHFQISVMNGVDPSPRQVMFFQQQLKTHRVKILFYNQQVDNPLMKQLLRFARSQAIPVIGVMETQPPEKTYVEWMMSLLKQVDTALYAPRDSL